MTAARAHPADPAEPDIALIVALSLVAGATDVTSFVLLGGLFSAHITGNLVVIAADLVAGTTPNLATCLAIPVFMMTAATVTYLTRRVISASPRTTTALLGAQALLLTGAALLALTSHSTHDPHAPLGVVTGVCAVAAMATQNTYLHLVPTKAYSTAVMTGNLVAAAVAATELLAGTGDHAAARIRWQSSWPLLGGFVGGCLLGAGAASMFHDRAAALPAVLAVIVMIAATAHLGGWRAASTMSVSPSGSRS